MKVYSQLIDLSKVSPQTFWVAPNSSFKLGVKLVQETTFKVLDGDAELVSDGEIDGFKTYSLESTAPGIKDYVVEAANGQKVVVKQVTTDSTVFEVGGGGSEEYVDNKVQEEANARATADEALRADIPTKTSELTNDSGFLTKAGTIDNALSADFASNVQWSGVSDTPTTLDGYGITDGATTEYVDNKVQEEADARAKSYDELKAALPTKTSQLDNDSGFLTHEGTIANAENAETANNAMVAETANNANSVEWSGVQSKPTTLDGYGITDAATTEYVDNQIGNVLTQEEF